jgi:hypothetical protein
MDITGIITTVFISTIIGLIIEYLIFMVKVPQNKESQDSYYGRLFWESKSLTDPDMTPQNRLFEMVKRWGSPSQIDRSSGGSAIWKKGDLKDSKFVRAEIVDEMIPHSKPAPHFDFFTTWYPLNISLDKEKNLHEISESIGYDPLKKWFYARCHDLRPNVVSTWIAKKYAFGDYSLEEAKKEYGPRIMQLMKDKDGLDGQLFKRYLSEL